MDTDGKTKKFQVDKEQGKQFDILRLRRFIHVDDVPAIRW
jgi:hypothetical protein